jgi:hypothetical protein
VPGDGGVTFPDLLPIQKETAMKRSLVTGDIDMKTKLTYALLAAAALAAPLLAKAAEISGKCCPACPFC